MGGVSGGVRRTFGREYRRAVAEQVTVEFEEFYPPLDTWFHVSAYPAEEGLAVVLQDVTERKRSEKADGEIELLLTDVVMPGMSGRELAARFACLCPDAPVLYMSAHTVQQSLGLDDSGATSDRREGRLHREAVLAPGR